MILLDTNVISEPWKREPDTSVLAWIDAQAIETLYLSTITVAEIRFGAAAMPAGKRRKTLHDRFAHDVLPLFEGRILSFDLDASEAYGDLMAQAKAAGKAIGKADGYIAAVAAAQGFAVATRDEGPFRAAGVQVINPWQS